MGAFLKKFFGAFNAFNETFKFLAFVYLLKWDCIGFKHDNMTIVYVLIFRIN